MTDQHHAQHGQLSAPNQPNLGHRASNMLIPDQIAALTRERDQARAEVEWLTRFHAIARMTVANLEQINIGLHEDLKRMELAEASRLAADQQHAGEPEPSAFVDPAPETTTGHVMPARALLHQKQAVGLLR
jgi:hypothetical protein